jgi:CubicO group peptidase (beta-lactamase class C family)
MKRIILCGLLLALFQSCHVGRFFIYNFSDVRDYKKFPSKKLSPSSHPFHFTEASGNTTVRLPQKNAKGEPEPFENRLKHSGTIAFMVIRNDSILYNYSGNGKDKSTIVPSFSMAKSFVSALIGIAIDEGYIKNTSEPITNYIDFLNKNEFGRITIQHVLDMQSGIHFNESYFNPFGEVAKYYYGNDLKKYMKHLKVEKAPGLDFEYKSVNTQLLAYILEKATGKTPTQYLQEKIWEPLGMEFDATWSIDSKKHQVEKAFCCINARARDFAKLGRLYLNNGNWNGKQIISSEYVKATTTFTTSKNDYMYSNQWWHTRFFYSVQDSARIHGQYVKVGPRKKEPFFYLVAPSGDFFMQGHLGQFVYVYPQKKIIIVRLGKREAKTSWPTMMREIAMKN